MDTIFTNSGNSKTSVLQILAFTVHMGNIKKPYQNNKCKISASTWNEEFELPDGSYSVSDTQDYFEYILKNMRLRILKSICK